MNGKAWIVRWLLCAFLCWSGWAWAGGVAEVLFLSGQSRWSADGIRAQTLQKGMQLPESARIETGEDGYVYLGTLDQGFLVLRPRTVARIARYQADIGGRVEIRLELEKGVARVVSGKAAQTQPQGFRMETPLAVIGVRGTDFSVLANNELTQVSVRSGGVVVSPLSDACRPGESGPCNGGQAAELYAHDRGQIIEVRRGAAQAIRLEPAGGGGPDSVAPPAGEENRQLERSRSGGSAVIPARLAETQAETQAENSITQTISAAEALPPATPPAPSIFWGRWAGVAASDVEAYSALNDHGRRATVAMNSWFAVTRLRELPVLPQEGVMSLSLAEAQALIVNQQGYILAPAQVTGGQLTLDFGLARFHTTLATQGGGYTAELRAAGIINRDGTFDSQWLAGSNGTVKGAIAAEALQAAYLFQQPLGGGAQATGVASWAR